VMNFIVGEMGSETDPRTGRHAASWGPACAGGVVAPQ
jgi:hypothetical protein